MNKHIELSVEVNPIWADYISEILISIIGCSGVVTAETEYKDEVITKDNKNIVKGYLWFNENNPPDINKIQNILLEKQKELIDSGINKDTLGSWKVSSKQVADEEWAHSWKKFWHPQKIGSRIIICPSWEQCEIQENEIKIDLDPGTAFGTGTHPTTRLCIVALEKYANEGQTMADIGTGSGILAIVGAKFGIQNIIGVDNDESVIETAYENATKNGVGDKCRFYTGSAEDVNGEFDIVTANILAEVLVSMMNDLNKLVKKGGKIIFSGIIIEKSDLVKSAAIKAGLKIIEILEEENWVAIIAEK